MGRAILAISGSAAGFLNRPIWSVSASAASFWRQLTQLMFDTYHPERHYMRGPGPACAAKRRPEQN
ncbi:MAG: hypothetical protein KIT48_12735 [Pseudolabrys sp.]|jgi:hypothetical protein|nr:hypothetical protein [Pseudolabrys sp.]